MLTAVWTHACVAESLITGARSLMPFFRVQTSGELSSSPQYHHAIVSVLPISSSPRATEQAKQLFSGGESTAARRDVSAGAADPAGSWRGAASGHRPPCKQPSSTTGRPVRPLVCIFRSEFRASSLVGLAEAGVGFWGQLPFHGSSSSLLCVVGLLGFWLISMAGAVVTSSK